MRGEQLQRVSEAEDDHPRHELPAHEDLGDGEGGAAAGRQVPDLLLLRPRIPATRPHHLGAGPQADYRRG